MCARLLSCPLCSQPGFVTLDALRAGLVSVATRPLACPVCNETLLGIDKLTIHLFGHTINSSGRSEARPATNRDGNPRGSARCDTLILPENWSRAQGRRALGDEPPPGGTLGENLSFLPATNSSSAGCAAAIVDGKPDSPSARDNPSFGAIGEKPQEGIIFLHNSSQRRHHQFSSPALISTEEAIEADSLDRKTYETSSSMGFHDSAQDKNSTPAPSAQSHTEEDTERRRAAEEVETHRTSAREENSSVEETEPKDESEEQYSETWIENLLRENSEKCFAASSKPSASENNSFSFENRSTFSNEENKFSSYAQSPTVQKPRSGAKEFTVISQDLSIREDKNMFAEDHNTSLSSIDVLPRLKALRLLAMKEKTERCDICGISVPDSNILVLHKQVVHMILEKDANSMPEEFFKNYPCHFCTKIFKNRGSLIIHMRIAHIGYNLGLEDGILLTDKEGESCPGGNGYNCPTCGKNFKKEQHVTQHLKTHEGKQWECDVCSKMFTTKYFLKKHKRLHSGEMPYKCTICEKTFTFQQSYHKHRLYHKDDKPHTCNVCSRSFKELSTLHNHERIHTGEKPFACETCGKCFRQRVSYLVHRRIHTGVMPYNCVACGKNFRYKVSQRTHKCPIQPEEAIPPGPEVAASSVAPPPSSSSDLAGIPKPTIFMDGGGIPEVPTVDNKFILIVNNQGQPILTRESDVRSIFSDENRNTESQEDKKINPSEANATWRTLSVGKICKISESPSTTEKLTRTEEKFSPNSTNDFFSSVMSPLEKDLSSPSSEMEHLRLSSPRNEDSRKSELVENHDTDNANVLQNDLNNAIEGIFRENCSGNGLETINEESLKQLLYDIDRKV